MIIHNVSSYFGFELMKDYYKMQILITENYIIPYLDTARMQVDIVIPYEYHNKVHRQCCFAALKHVAVENLCRCNSFTSNFHINFFRCYYSCSFV